MWFPDPNLIAGPKAATGFLGILWQELFDVGTPDSYQVRLSHTPSLIREICETCERLKSSNKWQSHLRVQQEELKAVSEDEADVLGFDEYYRWLVTQFHTLPPRKLTDLARVAFDFEDGYRSSVHARLTAACAGLPGAPVPAARALRGLATVAIQAGCYHDEMLDQVAEASFNLTPDQLVTNIQATINAAPQTYWCCLAISGPEQDIQALARNVDFRVQKAKRLDVDLKAKFKADAGQLASGGLASVTFVAMEQEARTRRDAARLAVRAVRNAVDVFNFYSEAPKMRILPLVLTRSVAGEHQLIELGEHQLKSRFPRRARQLTLATLEKVPSGNLGGRILNALEHYNLAHSSNATRVKLVNLWTALECLAGSTDSIIETVCDLVAPIAVWRRSDKLLTYAATCLNDSRHAGNSLPFPASLLAHGGAAVSREKLLLMLAKPANDPELQQLLAFTAHHPVLGYRFADLRASFADGRQLLKDLKRSHERVTWHLYRIYRSRNLIVHAGQDSRLIQPLLDHLHYYFSITLSRVLHGMQLRDGIPADGSAAYWRTRFDYLMTSLQRDPKRLRVSDFFALAASDADTKVWS